jgi:phenylpropionate dioxygenase-like ring-hydroxylating dioxygenase large terminal subunit
LTGPGTPGGGMMRCYWQPAALSCELKADEPLPVTLLGEELVMFRDDKGAPQLVQRACPHRSVDLSYGRVENGGIRCIYHGWLMDGRGRCVQQPGEPAGSTFKDKIRITAYPCHEAGGIILAYMGKGEPPALPGFHFLFAPEEQTFAMKVHQECNYLQANEGNIDPQHLSYLHRFLPSGSAANTQTEASGLNAIVSNDPAPEIHVEETAYGLRIHTARAYKPGRRWVRITNFVMPNASAIHGSPLTNPRNQRISENCGYQINWHVPIDDGNHWKYVIAHRFDGPVDREFQMAGFDQVTPDFMLPRGRENRFKQDRAEMKNLSFAGLGSSFYVHDKCATETQGVIMDRSNEHLGTTDRAVILMRKQLLAAVEDARKGKDPMMIDRTGKASSFAELTVLSQEVPADTDLAGGWWKPYFEGNKPKKEYTLA